MSDEVVNRSRFRIGDIHPAPDDEILAAITAALEVAWPEPTTAPSAATVDVRWRFGLRRWNDRPIPRQTWGRA